MKISTLIYNPIAGRHPARRERQIGVAAELLRNAGVTVKLTRTSGPGSARDLARAAVAQGDNLILVSGGDGTINDVVNGIATREVTLGILPGGTANVLAKELGLPNDPVRAARQLPSWSPRRIPLGRATWSVDASDARSPLQARFFLSVAGIGFDAYIVHKLSSDMKLSFGVAAYVAESLRQVSHYSFPPFVCRLEGREFRATFAVVHRTRLYAGWLHLAPDFNLFRNQLGLCLFKSRRRARYILYALAVLARQHLRLEDVELMESRRIVCEAMNPKEPIYFELDGELAGKLPATFEIVPDALPVLAP